MDNILNCIMEGERITENDVKIISVLGSEYNKELMMKHNAVIKDVIMFDLIIEDFRDINNEIDGYYSITQLNGYNSSLKLFSKYDVKYYEYYGMLTARIIEIVLNSSDSVNTYSFNTFLSLPIIEDKYSFQFSNQHLISDSLSFIKVLGNGKYEEKSLNLFNVYQEEFGYFYESNNDKYLYCDWNSENIIREMKIKYIIILNKPFDELTMFVNTVIDKLPFVDEMTFKLIAFPYGIKYEIGSKEYNETIEYLMNKYNPLFIGGKTCKERIIINSLLSNNDVYLFDIFPYNNDECLNRVYHLNTHSFKKLYDTLYYFIFKGGKHFNIFIEKTDIIDEIFVDKELKKLNESYNAFDIDFHVFNENDEIDGIKETKNCVIYILLYYNNTKNLLNKLNENGINNTNCNIILMNDYPLYFYNSEEYRNYYFIDSILSYTNNMNYYNKYSLDLLQSIDFNILNTDVYVSAYLSVLIYGKALISQSFYNDKLIGELLHETIIPIEILYKTSFSKYNQLNFPTKLFKAYPYTEYLINVHIHFVPLVDYSSKVCDCEKIYILCYNRKIINIGFLYDSKNYEIESKYLIITSNLILDNYMSKKDNINKAYIKPIYFDIEDIKEIENIIISIESYNIYHIFGGINQTYVDNIMNYHSNNNNKIQIWYTNNNYIRNECNEYVFNFGQSLNELFDVFYQSLTINSIGYCIITDCEDIYTSEYINKYNDSIIFINNETSNDILFNQIISILPKGGYIMIYLKYSDLKFLLMLEDYMNSSFFQYKYNYYFMNPEYSFDKESSLINQLSNVYTFSFLNENSTEFTELFKSFYGNNCNDDNFMYMYSYEIYVTNAIVTFLDLSESLHYNISNLVEYQKTIFSKSFSFPSGELSISPDYTFVYPISQIEYKNNKFIYDRTINIDPEVTINYNSQCDFRNPTNINNKVLINMYLLSNKEEEYLEISSIINSYLKESNNNNTNFKFSLKLLPFYDIDKFNISLNSLPSNSIYIGVPLMRYKKEIECLMKEKESVLFYVGYAEPNNCYSNIISMNNYLPTYILPIILYIKEKCSNLIVLYNKKSEISIESARFFKNEVEYMNISSILFINIINSESLKQFVYVNQKLIFEPNCVINFLDNNFTSTLIKISENIVSYSLTIFSFNVNDYNFPYSSLIKHYIVTNYNPFDESSELINEIKRRIVSVSIKPYPITVYSYMSAKYISDYVSNLNSSEFLVKDLLKKISNIKILHPSNLKVKINDGNYLNQPLLILFHNSIGFNFNLSFSINEEIETYPYSLRKRLVCSFNNDENDNNGNTETIEPIRFGYIYSLGKNEIMSLSYKILLNQILSLSHLSLYYEFIKRVGLEYHLYNINNDDKNCKDGLLYMSERNVEYLFTSNENVCFNSISELIPNYPNMIYFYSGYTYYNQCIKQIFYTELLPSQIFPSLLSLIDFMKLDGSFVVYDNNSISSREYKMILENLISEYHFGINDYVDTNDIEKYKSIIHLYKNNSYIYVGSFECFSKVVDDFRSICGDDKYHLLFISTNQYSTPESFIYDKNLYFFSSPIYGDKYFNEFLYKYSMNKSEHIFNLETTYLSHQIIFDLLNETDLNNIHNRSVFLNDIYTKKIKANETEIYFTGNNNINRRLIVNNNNNIIKEFSYFIESKVNSTLICKFDEDLKVVNMLILIDENEQKLYLHTFINILISNLNNMKENIYFNHSFVSFNKTTCSERINNYYDNANYDLLLYISPKVLYCSESLINEKSNKPIFIITNNETEICKENIYLNGMIIQQYLSPAFTYSIYDFVYVVQPKTDGIFNPYYVIFWISEEYIKYYKNIIEEFKINCRLVYTQFNNDFDELLDFVNTIPEYSVYAFVEQNETLLKKFYYYHLDKNSIYCKSIIVPTIVDIKWYYPTINSIKNEIDDDDISSIIFYRMMDDAKGCDDMYYDKDFSNYIPSIYSTILFLKKVMQISNSVKYDEYKQYLYNTEIDSVEGKVRLRKNNIFENDYNVNTPFGEKLKIYRNDFMFYKTENYECNIKDNNGLIKLSPLYVGLFIYCENESIYPYYQGKSPVLIINTILDRIYMLRKTTYILKKYYIHPIYGCYVIDDNYTNSFLSFINNRKDDLSVIFLTIPKNVDKKIMEKICDDKQIIMFNIDDSININSKYFINAGLSADVYSSILFKNSIKNSTFVYIVGDENSFKTYSQLFDLYKSANINYTLIDIDYVYEAGLSYVKELIEKCDEYSNGHYCSIVVLVSYSKAMYFGTVFYYIPDYKDKLTIFILGSSSFTGASYLNGWHSITSYSPLFNKNDLNIFGNDVIEFNNYMLYTPSHIIVDFSYSYQEIVYSTASIYVQLLNKSMSIKPSEIINNIYYSEFHSASGRLYISDKNNVERRVFTGVYNFSIDDSFNIESYSSIVSASLYDSSYYTNITYIGVLLDYDEVHEFLSRILLLSINEFILDENSKGKQFKSKLYILYHNENDVNIIHELMNDDEVNFLIGCVSLYCTDLVIESMTNRNDKLFFSSIETENSLCEKHVITSSLPLNYKIEITLKYLKMMKISKLIFFYEKIYQLDFINEIKKEMNDTESIVVDINDKRYSDSSYIDSLLKNSYNIIILNLLKESRLKSFLEIYINSEYSKNVFNHVLYYYNYYYIGKELKSKLNNFIILSCYSGDTRDMSVFLFEQYLQDRLGSNLVVSPELASADCLFKLLVSSYEEAMKIMLEKNILLSGENIVEYTQIFSQSISMNCGLGRVKGTISNTLSHQLYLSEISQTDSFIKIYPDWSVMIEPYNELDELDEEACYNGPMIINYEYSEKTLIGVLSIFIFFTLFHIMLLILIIRNKQQHIIKRSSLIILIYAIISNYLILLMSIVKNFNMNNNWLCKIYDTFTSACIINALLVIVLKSWRIHLIYNNNKMKRIRITSQTIIILCLSLTLIWIFYCLISGLIYDFGVVKRTYSSEYSNEIKVVYVTTCSYNQAYNLIEIFVIYGIAAIGVYFSWSTRKVSDSYSESHALIASIFFICIFILAYFCISMMIIYKPDDRLLFDILSLGFSGIFCICLMVIPKIYHIYFDSEKLSKSLCCISITKVFPTSNTSTSESPQSPPEQKSEREIDGENNKEKNIEEKNDDKEPAMRMSHIKINTFGENGSNNVKITIRNNNVDLKRYVNNNNSNAFISCPNHHSAGDSIEKKDSR